MTESADLDFINTLPCEDGKIEINSINLIDVMDWVLDQNQDTKIQLLKFVFNQSGLMSNREASKINKRSESAETQHGKKEQIGHFKYARIET